MYLQRSAKIIYNHFVYSSLQLDFDIWFYHLLARQENHWSSRVFHHQKLNMKKTYPYQIYRFLFKFIQFETFTHKVQKSTITLLSFSLQLTWISSRLTFHKKNKPPTHQFLCTFIQFDIISIIFFIFNFFNFSLFLSILLFKFFNLFKMFFFFIFQLFLVFNFFNVSISFFNSFNFSIAFRFLNYFQIFNFLNFLSNTFKSKIKNVTSNPWQRNMSYEWIAYVGNWKGEWRA